MADKTLNTRISLKYDEYADWKAQNPVLMKGEVAITSIPTTTSEKPEDIKSSPPIIAIKVGDGKGTHYLDLPFVSGFQADVYPWAKKTNPDYNDLINKPSLPFGNYVLKQGDEMSGNLSITATPSTDTHAVTKGWVESKGYATKKNPTFEGTVKLPTAAPTANDQAAHKKYVDDTAAAAAKQVDNKLSSYVLKAGDTMGGHLTLHDAPTENMHAATKKYVDDGVQGAKSYADGIKTSLGSVFTYKGTVASLDALNTNHPASADQVGHVYHVTQKHAEYVCAKVDSNTAYTWEELGSAVDLSNYYTETEANDKFIWKSGDTNGVMSGYLTLHAAPAENMHAATKKYVDDHTCSVTDTAKDGEFVTKVYKEGNVIKALRSKVNVNHLDQTSGDTLILNCGDAKNCGTITQT